MTFNNLDAIRFEGGILNPPFSCIKLTGDDVVGFLNGQTINDVKWLNVENAIMPNATVDSSGRAEYLFAVAIFNHCYHIICRPGDVDLILDRLNRFIITDDVSLEIVDQLNFIIGVLSIASFQEQGEVLAKGFFFNDQVALIQSSSTAFHNHKHLDQNIFNEYLAMSGFPLWDIDFKQQNLITNSQAAAFINFKKGCFIGQEVLAKIINNRGAAYYPAYIIVDELFGVNELGDLIAQKIINECYFTVTYQSKKYLYVSLHRSYRVEDKTIEFAKSKIQIKLNPPINNHYQAKAKWLYDEALFLFAKTDKIDQAVYLLKLAILCDNTFVDAYESLGVILDRMGNTHNAIDIMHELIKVNSDIPMAYTNLSLFYMKVGEIKKAEDYKAQATLAQFRHQAQINQNHQVANDQKKRELEQLLERQNMFTQVLEIDSEDIIALNGLGEVYYKLGQFKQAKEYLMKAIEFSPKHSVAYLNLGECLIALNEQNEAKRILAKGIEVASIQGELMPANKMQAHLNQLNS